MGTTFLNDEIGVMRMTGLSCFDVMILPHALGLVTMMFFFVSLFGYGKCMWIHVAHRDAESKCGAVLPQTKP
jgi:hypothetical protein